jgi:hypothetical protein
LTRAGVRKESDAYRPKPVTSLVGSTFTTHRRRSHLPCRHAFHCQALACLIVVDRSASQVHPLRFIQARTRHPRRRQRPSRDGPVRHAGEGRRGTVQQKLRRSREPLGRLHRYGTGSFERGLLLGLPRVRWGRRLQLDGRAVWKLERQAAPVLIAKPGVHHEAAVIRPRKQGVRRVPGNPKRCKVCIRRAAACAWTKECCTAFSCRNRECKP